jgi:Ni2+-binding GTPase involved in maturation of urease and hydrogenase
VGVVTNDQGKYLVDTAFFRLADIPAVEVSGGCFCCNYPNLDKSLDELVESARPDVIFAESVGSCADLVATVVKPLLTLKAAGSVPTSFTVFTDGRLLTRRLLDQPMPFSDDVIYIFDKQIEEAGLIVVNKLDLLSAKTSQSTLDLMRGRYPDKEVIGQATLVEGGVAEWLERLDSGSGLLPGHSLAIDYARYGRGEAQLAWLDETVWLQPQGEDAALGVRRMITSILAALKARQVGVGHVKFILKGEGFHEKISFTTLEEAGWEELIPANLGPTAEVLINARVEMGAEELREIVQDALVQAQVSYLESGVDYFHPGQPNPTHRIS